MYTECRSVLLERSSQSQVAKVKVKGSSASVHVKRKPKPGFLSKHYFTSAHVQLLVLLSRHF